MSPTSPRVVFNNRPRFILDLNERSDAADRAALGGEGHPSDRAVAHEMHAQIEATLPRCRRPDAPLDFETEPRLERIFAQMRTEARAGAPPARWKRRPEAHRFHGGADYFIASRTTLVAGALWARASTIVTVQAPRVTRRRSRIVIVARPWSTRP